MRGNIIIEIRYLSNEQYLSVTSESEYFFIYPLFLQEGPIEIKINLFFQGVLAKMAVLKFNINI